MAQPSGSCSVADMGYYLSHDYDYLHCLVFIREQPMYWQNAPTDTRKRHGLRINRDLTIVEGAGAEDTLTEEYKLESCTNKTLKKFESDSATDGWQTDSDIKGDNIKGVKFEKGTLAASSEDHPRFICGAIRLAKTSDHSTVFYLNGIYLEELNDLDYDDPIPAGEQKKVEKITRITQTKLIYGAGHAISSYLMMEGVCHTLNKIEYQSRWAQSVPLFGGQGHP